MSRYALSIFGILAILIATSPSVHGQEAGDVWVGASGAGQVTLSPFGLVPEEGYVFLPPGGAFFPGWADSDPGFDHVTSVTPAEDVFPLPSGVDIFLEVIEFDPAFRMVILGNPPIIVDQPGQIVALGGSDLHEHFPWHINADDPAFDPEQCVWNATFVLFDAGSASLDDSRSFTFSFTNVEWGPGVQPVPILADGDFDNSGMVDDDDLPAFAECMSSPGQRPAPNDPAITLCEVDCANAFDFDIDLDVDLEDYAELQRRP